MRRFALRCASLVAACAAVLGLAACGSGSSSTTATRAAAAASSSSSSSSVATAVTTTTTTTTVPASSSSSSSSAASTTAAATAATAPQGCGNTQVAVSVGRATAGAGHAGLVILLRNVRGASCTLTGYPGAALVGSGQRQIQAARTPNGYLGGLAPQDSSNPIVTLQPGATASALLEGDDVNASGGSCPSYGVLLVTPPNTTATHQLATTLRMCRPQIHPVVPGTSGRQG